MSTYNIPFLNMKKKIILKYYPKSAAMGFLSKGPKNEFETAVVIESSVFEPLKFDSIFFSSNSAAVKLLVCIFSLSKSNGSHTLSVVEGYNCLLLFFYALSHET